MAASESEAINGDLDDTIETVQSAPGKILVLVLCMLYLFAANKCDLLKIT